MRKQLLFVVFFLFSVCTWAQERTVSGKVTSADDGSGLPGVNVVLKGTSTGTVTDVDGNYALQVPAEGGTLQFSFVGMETREVPIGTRSVVDVAMQPDVQQLSEVVVTALGIEREERALGYSVQKVGGEEIARTNEGNVINSLSGKVAGVQVRTSNTMGGSANILIRGSASLSGNNQPLFVVDGVPIDNNNYNSANQVRGAGGYDLGNPAADINPSDIESVTVLKGGSAAALYGSRALNGVILITTKKGKETKGIGVSVSSSITVSRVNEATLPQHQKQYGAGYGRYFEQADLDGDGQLDLIVPTYDDASWGHAFDPELQVVHWDALDPRLPNYGEKRPWVAGANGIEDFFETGLNLSNTIAVTNATDKGSFRLSYTNESTEGILPNSEIDRNMLSFNSSLQFSDKATASVSANYINTDVVGRYGTGYTGTNVMQSFGQWFQTNVDMDRLVDYRNEFGEQRAWNYHHPITDLRPYYFDNPYWVRYENFENDNRDRLFGNVLLQYDLMEGLTINGRSSVDFYNFTVEERIAKGSAITSVPMYSKDMYKFRERNDELFLTGEADLGEVFSLTGLLGISRRSTMRERTQVETFNGLVIDRVYSVDNTLSPEIGFTDDFTEKKQRSVYGSLSLGFNNMLFLDLTARNDWSSALPKGENSYFYPSVSTSFVFTELGPLNNSDILSFGKLRFNWSRVGNDAPAYSTINYFAAESSFGGTPVYRLPTTLNNPDLKSETKEGIEIGTELMFFQRRINLDIAVYKENTTDQIIPVEVSRGTGYNYQFINAGEIENKGIEIALNAGVLQGAFSWNVGINWTKNKNKVVSLAADLKNYVLGSNFFASINATEGEPYGTIRGTNYVYHANGEPLIDEATGRYLVSDSEEVIGNITPDWNAGITNTFTYKGFVLSTLIDIQRGGDVFSLNTAFGRATGLYEETAGLNARGGLKRNPVSEGGGVLFSGVNEDGSPNETYARADTWGTAWSYNSTPAAAYVFDVSYIKLREVRLGYKLPAKLLENMPISNVEISFIGQNLAIIDDNVTHFDPEVTSSSGNVQGYESGTYPTPRTYGFNLKFNL